MARPPKDIKVEQVLELARVMCSNEEIGRVVGCSVDTLERRFADVIKDGRAHAKVGLRRVQFSLALGGNPTMCIWLGKQLLDQKDAPGVQPDPGKPLAPEVCEVGRYVEDENAADSPRAN